MVSTNDASKSIISNRIFVSQRKIFRDAEKRVFILCNLKFQETKLVFKLYRDCSVPVRTEQFLFALSLKLNMIHSTQYPRYENRGRQSRLRARVIRCNVRTKSVTCERKGPNGRKRMCVFFPESLKKSLTVTYRFEPVRFRFP